MVNLVNITLQDHCQCWLSTCWLSTDLSLGENWSFEQGFCSVRRKPHANHSFGDLIWTDGCTAWKRTSHDDTLQCVKVKESPVPGRRRVERGTSDGCGVDGCGVSHDVAGAGRAHGASADAGGVMFVAPSIGVARSPRFCAALVWRGCSGV